MIGQTIGPYEILEKIGEGGLGVVYKARDQRLRRTVALKCISDPEKDSGTQKRFLREAQAASALNHPHIVTIHDIVDQDGQTFLVMEYLEGDPIRRLIPEGGMSPRTAIDYALQIAEALAVAHAAGIVHRDLKPENAIVTPSGQVKLLDFGLAKIEHASPDHSTETMLTRHGAFVGTVAYVSPEQAMNRALDHRSDIFSFGVMLYEMLAGHRPFRGETSFEVVLQIHTSAPAPLRSVRPEIPISLEIAVLKMLEKRPEDRWQSMREVIESLTPLRAVAATAAAPASEPAAPPDASPPLADEKPSVAVLPFRPIPADTQGENLSDGIAAEIVRALSGVPDLRVKSQVTSQRLQSHEQDLARLAESLQIRYLLTGTIRHSGDRVRIMADLVDPAAGTQLWTRSYDRNCSDLFAFQEEIANTIAASMSGPLLRVRAERASSITTAESLDPAALVRKAHRAVIHAYHREGLEQANDLVRRAVQLAPDYALGHAYLGFYINQSVINGFSENPKADRAAALAEVERAMQLAPADPEVLENAGLVLLHSGQYERCIHVLRRAVEIAQFDLIAWGYLGLSLGMGGDAPDMEEAQTILDRLIREAPDHPALPYWLYFKSSVCVRQGKYQEGADCAQRSAEIQPRFLIALLSRANALGHMGRKEEAWEVVTRAMALNQSASQEYYISELYQIGRTRERVRPHIEGLIAAGIFKDEG